MTSVCISNCVSDTRVPVRSTYVNLHRWPETDAEFIKSVCRVGRGLHGQPKVVDSKSCRQLYLRSYTFSREESIPEKTKKCFGMFKEKVADHGKNKKDNNKERRKARKRKCLVLRKVKEISCGALFRIFYRLLSCGASIDVVDGHDDHH